MVDLSILKNAGVVEILLYLLDYPGGRRKVDMRTDLGLNPATAIKAHKLLIEAGFLKGMEYENATAYALTEHALIIANKLSEIEKMLHVPADVKSVKDSYVVEVIRRTFDPDKKNRP